MSGSNEKLKKIKNKLIKTPFPMKKTSTSCRSTIDKYHLKPDDKNEIHLNYDYAKMKSTLSETEKNDDKQFDIYTKAIQKKVRRGELKEKFIEYLHLIEIAILLIGVVMAMFYQYTDFMKAHPSDWRRELGLYFGSALLSYMVILIFRQPLGVFRKFAAKEFAKQFGIMISIGLVTVLVIYIVELGGCNNLIVSSLGTGNTVAGCEIYNEMKVPPFSSWGCSPPASTPDSRLLSMIFGFLVLVIVFACCYMYFSNPIFAFLGIGAFLAFLVMFIYYNAKDSVPYNTNSIHSVGGSISTSSPPLTTTEQTILNFKNNWVGYMLISAGITFLALAMVALLLVILFIVFGIHTLSFYSYFAGMKAVRGSTLHLLTFFVFILEATLVSFIMTYPYMRTVINRNIFFNPDYRWQDDTRAKGLFRDVWIKIGCFYLFLQLAGNFEWTNKGYCRSSDGYNIIIDSNSPSRDPVDVYLADPKNLLNEKIDLFRKESEHKLEGNNRLLSTIFGMKKKQKPPLDHV